MRITNAVYQLSEIQRTRVEARGQADRVRRSAATHPAGPEIPSSSSQKDAAKSPQEHLSLPEMLHEHFVNEVRRRDRDADGRLSRGEFGGSREEFDSLDRTGKGYVSAKDLTREALARNPELQEIVSGRWTPVYESLIQVQEPTDENLLNAVREGAARVLDQGEQDVDSTAPDKDRITAVSADFIMNHRDLAGLHSRLQTLADRLGRFRRYAPVDLTG